MPPPPASSFSHVSPPRPAAPSLPTDMNKNHIITKEEFRKSLKNFLALSEKDIDMLVPRFFSADDDLLTYDTCVSSLRGRCVARLAPPAHPRSLPSLLVSQVHVHDSRVFG